MGLFKKSKKHDKEVVETSKSNIDIDFEDMDIDDLSEAPVSSIVATEAELPDLDDDDDDFELDFGEPEVEVIKPVSDSKISLDKTSEIEDEAPVEEDALEDFDVDMEEESSESESEELTALSEDEEVEELIEDTEEQTEDTFDEITEENSEDEKASEKVVSDVDVQDLILYIITDKPRVGMINYFRDYGVRVSQIFSNVDEAKDVLLMQVEPSRIVIIDTGTGRFTNMAARKSLVDLLGISDEDNKISLFYTDSVIKSEVQNSPEVDGKTMDWHKYRSTADVLANILQKSRKENYVYDMEVKEEVISENVLNITGLPMVIKKEFNLGNVTITPSEIFTNRETEDKEHMLPAYAMEF